MLQSDRDVLSRRDFAPSSLLASSIRLESPRSSHSHPHSSSPSPRPSDSENRFSAVDEELSDHRHESSIADGTDTGIGTGTSNVVSANLGFWRLSGTTTGSRIRIFVLVGSAILQLPIWGFAMSYGVFQEFYYDNWTLKGGRDVTGVIGTTSNGVMYLSMPILFALFSKRWARYRQIAAVCGAFLSCFSFVLSSFSTHVWHLVATQGILAALGCALIYSPTTLSLGEWYNTSNRAVAYGIVLSCKNIVGSTCPFLLRFLLDRCGFRIALRVWAIVTVTSSIVAIFLIPTHPSSMSTSTPRGRKIPWHFLRHHTFYVYSIAIILQSAGYGIPQTYLSTYAREVTHLSQTSATMLLTVFNLPGIIASSFFGFISDNKWFTLSATTTTTISAASSALAAFLLWGLTSQGSMALLVMFSIIFGFFAGGYSATWGGVINELESEAAHWNEAVDTGILYGLLNGARGIGYVSGGLAGVPLLKAGSMQSIGKFAYGSSYGPLIVFTGLSSAFGGFGILWKGRNLSRLIRL